MIGADGLVAVNKMPVDEGITALLHAGMALFPCEPGGKKPATAHGFKNARSMSIDQRSAKTSMHGWPVQYNVGLATGLASGVDVLDVDVKSGVDGRRALRTLSDAGLLEGHVATATTPSGGMHVYFPTSGGRSGAESTVGLDWKANGGYVLTSPSSILDFGDGDMSETFYQWTSSRSAPEGQPLDWTAARKLLGTFRPSVPVRHSAVLAEEPREVAERLAHFLTGQPIERNNYLYWASRKVVEAGGGQPELEVLVAASLTLSEPGEDREAECWSTALSALRSLS